MWKCEKCFGSPYIVHKNRDTETNPNCERCEKDCSEIISQRSTSTFCSVRVFELETFKNTLNNKTSHAFTIELKLYDDLCQDLKLGQEFIVIGNFEPANNYYNVSSILPAEE